MQLIFSSLYRGPERQINIEITKGEMKTFKVILILPLFTIYVLCDATYPDDKDPLN